MRLAWVGMTRATLRPPAAHRIRGRPGNVDWRGVDLDRAELRVARVLEQTAKDVALKEPKTERSRRAISHRRAGQSRACDLSRSPAHAHHIALLLHRGLPVHVVSGSAGHTNPAVTLNIYAHVMPGQQEDAAAIVDSARRAALQDQS